MHDMIEKARKIAFAAHDDKQQVRKYTGEPYTVHLANVAGHLSMVTNDPEIIAAGLLHDTLEDTDLTEAEIEYHFGARVLRLVKEVTDVSKPSDGNRKVRKALDRAHLAVASPDGKTIKLADLIDNTSTIVKYDRNFAKVYLREKADLLLVLADGNPKLYALATKSVADGMREIFGGEAVA